jgi:formylglycine-generating enzyme required for sulfatase activity
MYNLAPSFASATFPEASDPEQFRRGDRPLFADTARSTPDEIADLAGNVWEWVADWVPLSDACVAGILGVGDFNCFAGASTTGGPGALIRGGDYSAGSLAGVFAVIGHEPPGYAGIFIGFRAAR